MRPSLCLILIMLSAYDCIMQDRSLLEWAKVYPGVDSKNVELGCNHKGRPFCCSYSDTTKSISYNTSSTCITLKKYIPSPYELRHQLKAIELQLIEDLEDRRLHLLEYITSPDEVHASITWLQRVKFRMSSPVNLIKETAEDREYLSRFVITKMCDYFPHGTHKHVEWIEPLTLHGRHPFGMAHCTYPYQGKDSVGEYLEKNNPHMTNIKKHYRSIFSVDYVLLHPGRLPKNRHRYRYMLDAGTSDFWSSLWWFTCAYSQMGIHFDQLLGWELSLLEPTSFWSSVPDVWSSRYSFFNIPISPSVNNTASPLNSLLPHRLDVHPNDFVAFKLDIDTPSVEVPIALQLLNDQHVTYTESDGSTFRTSKYAWHDIIDEFFFELHFRCEIMMYCGWDTEMPQSYKYDGHELKLDRASVLQFFSSLRRKGVRSHFWP